jgi:hypothetical protein
VKKYLVFFISSGDVPLSKWEDDAPIRKECVRMKDVNSDKLEGFIQNR